MTLNLKRYVLAIIAVFMGYFIVYTGAFALIGFDPAAATYARSADDPFSAFTMPGHFVQTLVIVTIYFVWVRSDNIRIGALYGLMMGLYFTATQFSTMGSMATYPASALMAIWPIHLLAGVLAGGMIPAMLYAEAKPSAIHAE